MRAECAVALVGVALLPVAVVGPAVAQETTEDRSGPDVDELVEGYNEDYRDAPEVIQTQFGGDTVEIRWADGAIPAKDEGTAYTLTLGEDGKVVSHTECGTDDEDVRVRTSRETVERIVESDEPEEAFEEAHEDGEIRITGVGLHNAVKVELAKLAVWFGRTFGLF